MFVRGILRYTQSLKMHKHVNVRQVVPLAFLFFLLYFILCSLNNIIDSAIEVYVFLFDLKRPFGKSVVTKFKEKILFFT